MHLAQPVRTPVRSASAHSSASKPCVRPLCRAAAPAAARPAPRRSTLTTARAGGGKKQGGGWLGGLPSWPSRGEDEIKEDDEEDDDDSMRPIDEVLGDRGSGAGASGQDDPLALLMVGLSAEELERLRASLLAIDADIVRLIPCPRAALEANAGGAGSGAGSGSGGAGQLTLEEAVSLPECPLFEPAPDDLPGPVAFLSGMSPIEVAEIVHCYRETLPPLPRAAFCALVPNNRSRSVRDLVDSVWRDERRLREQREREQRERERDRE